MIGMFGAQKRPECVLERLCVLRIPGFLAYKMPLLELGKLNLGVNTSESQLLYLFVFGLEKFIGPKG
jgi:hypothetical protein